MNGGWGQGNKCVSICISKHGICLYKSPLVSGNAPNTPPSGIMKEVIILRSRQNGVLIYLSDTEKQHLVKQAALAGVNVGAFIRKLIMGKEIRPHPPDEYVRLLREINAIGNNINQIAHIANAERHISKDKIEEVLNLQNDIMRLVRSVR